MSQLFTTRSYRNWILQQLSLYAQVRSCQKCSQDTGGAKAPVPTHDVPSDISFVFSADLSCENVELALNCLHKREACAARRSHSRNTKKRTTSQRLLFSSYLFMSTTNKEVCFQLSLSKMKYVWLLFAKASKESSCTNYSCNSLVGKHSGFTLWHNWSFGISWKDKAPDTSSVLIYSTGST